MTLWDREGDSIAQVRAVDALGESAHPESLTRALQLCRHHWAAVPALLWSAEGPAVHLCSIAVVEEAVRQQQLCDRETPANLAEKRRWDHWRRRRPGCAV